MANGLVQQAQGAPMQEQQAPVEQNPVAAQQSPQGMVGQGTPGGEEMEGEEATPEEQKFYEAALNMAGEFLYKSEEATQGILKLVDDATQGGSQEEAVGDAVSLIVGQIDDAMQGKLPETVILPVSMEIAQLISEMAEEAGIIDVPDEDSATRIMAATMASIMDDYGIEEADIEELAAGIPEAELQAAMGEIDGMMKGGEKTSPEKMAPAESPDVAAPEQTPSPDEGMGGY